MIEIGNPDLREAEERISKRTRVFSAGSRALSALQTVIGELFQASCPPMPGALRVAADLLEESARELREAAK